MAENGLSPEVVALLPQLGSTPASAADQLKTLADAGDEDAIVLAAWALLQAGRWQEGVPCAEQAAELGAIFVAANYVGTLVGQPEQRETTLRLMRTAMEAGWQADPLGWLPTFAQQGDTEAAAALIEMSRMPWPRIPDERVKTLMNRLRKAAQGFERREAEVEPAKSDAITNIESREQEVNNEVERLKSLGHKVETLAHEAASEELARQYSQQAKRNERAANWFTFFALVVFAVATFLAAYFTLKHINDKPGITEGIAKAGIAIPIALFGAFLARLASRFRQMGWRWRHMELQLRTAEPYIAELDEEQRAHLIQTLALRFFPGQPLDITGGRGAADFPTSSG
jgi:hypothetical protein